MKNDAKKQHVLYGTPEKNNNSQIMGNAVLKSFMQNNSFKNSQPVFYREYEVMSLHDAVIALCQYK